MEETDIGEHPNNTTLPLLPGYAFGDAKKDRFHKSQCFDFKLGVPDAKVDLNGVGRINRDIQSMQFYHFGPETNYDPSLVYEGLDGKSKKKSQPFKPHFVTYDKSCLRFRGYFKQLAFNTASETHRYRVVDLLYFLEDDTVTVIEPKVANSGLPQGRLVRRCRIPQGPLPDCEFLHWKDLNLGKEFLICGFQLRLFNCDDFTRRFLEGQGVELNPTEALPEDAGFCHMNDRKYALTNKRPVTASTSSKQKKFFQYDGVVLKFRAIFENFGDEIHYGVYYYPSDDTIQISEIYDCNDGRDLFPVLLKRTKLPKAWDKIPLTYPSILDESVEEISSFYSPRDLRIGERIVVFGREMLLYKCDDFTREFYKSHFNIIQPDNISMEKASLSTPTVKPSHQLPPYTGFGTIEDSLQSCLSFSNKSPRKDVVRKIVNANHLLRYKAKLCSTHAEDADREFVLSYSLADGTIAISEPPRRNSGHVGGRFLSSVRVAKPGTSSEFPEYYSPHDFFIGNIIVINKFRFEIVGADLHVFNYMKNNTEKFKPEVQDSIAKYVEESGLIVSGN